MERDAGSGPRTQRRILTIALGLNLVMFAIGLAAGLFGQSSGLIADALDMLADASGYVIALAAVDRSQSFKAGSALFSGSMLLLLGIGVLADIVRRLLGGSEPVSVLMIAAAGLSLLVNGFVLRLLRPYRDGAIHLRAAYVETRVDVIVNLSVVLAGALVLVTANRYADLIVGACIGLYVIKEALELVGEARESR